MITDVHCSFRDFGPEISQQTLSHELSAQVLLPSPQHCCIPYWRVKLPLLKTEAQDIIIYMYTYIKITVHARACMELPAWQPMQPV